MDEPLTNKMSHANGSSASPSHLTDALGSMVIDNLPLKGDSDEDANVNIRRPRRSSARPLVRSDTLLSLSANSNEILARLSQPGILDGDGDKLADTSKGARIVRWHELVAATPVAPKRTMKSKTPMPGTLIPPSPESSFASSSGLSYMKAESPSANSMPSGRTPQRALNNDDTNVDKDEDEDTPSSSQATVTTHRAAPLSRTMSAAERDEFVSKLSGEAPATIYIIPKPDVDAVISQARSLKFITELVMNDDENDPNALVILGRGEKAVQDLLSKIEKENQTAQESPSKVQSRLKTAGAVVVGAVGAWAGLAYA